MAYAIFESTNMRSTHYAERILDAVDNSNNIENGLFGYLTGLADIQTFNAGTNSGAVTGKDLVVVDNPAWNEEMINSGLRGDLRRDNYINEAGVPFRVRRLHLADTFAISKEAVTSATQSVLATALTGDTPVAVYLTVDATTGKLVASTTQAQSATFEAVVDKVRTVGATVSTTAHTYGVATKMYEATIIVLS